jgi:hypothetical protein
VLDMPSYNIAFSENDSEKIEGFGVTVDEVHFHAQCWTRRHVLQLED